MASFIANLATANVTGFLQSAATNLAVIHCKVAKTSDSFSKIEIEFSLDANWQITYNGKQLILDKITVQVGYANDSGEVTYKNSGIVANLANQAMSPMIWVKANAANVYRTTYTASQSLSLQFNYSAAFQLNADLPPELQNAFTGKEIVTIDTVHSSSDYSVKISII